MKKFPTIGLLITHYNRSRSLEHLLTSFERLDCEFGDVVVSDDGSKPEHLSYVQKLQFRFQFNLVTTPQNRGLGNNINKGQDAIKTPYTLYIQEDFEPAPEFPEKLINSLELITKDKELDMIRFYAYTPYPYVKKYTDDFFQMRFKPFGTRYKKIHCYSDHPHLRRSTFLEKFGRYSEGISGDKTEYNMSLAFIQNKGKGIIYRDCYALFTQRNTNEEPSTMIRKGWEHQKGTINKIRRLIYRQIKYNYDVKFKNIHAR